MISLKKHIEEHREELLRSTLDCYRNAVAAMAESGGRVCPTLAETFFANLMALRDRLSVGDGTGPVAETEQAIERELEGWGTRASDYFKQKAGEIRDIMLAMAEAARAVGERDVRYREQFRRVSERLHEIGNLEDLSRIRLEIKTSAGELRSSVDRMVEEGKQSVSRLQAELAAYQERLAEAERVSTTDPLTGLANRAGVEREIEARIRAQRRFSLMIVDLNGFKAINDTHGHAAGDHLLKSFAVDFKAQFRPLDPIGRWGGDEFVAVLDCGLQEANARQERVRKWVLGEYTVPAGGKSVKVTVGAAIGLAEWAAGKTAEHLFCEADRAMYADKKSR